MCNTGIEDFEQADDETLLDGMERAARLGLPVAVHAENDTVTQELAARAVRRAPCDVRLPALAACDSRARGGRPRDRDRRGDGLLAAYRPREPAAAVLLVAEARARGVDVTCETCPHYLLLDRRGRGARSARSRSARRRCGRARGRGSLGGAARRHGPVVASDHSPAPPDMKAGDDAFAIWGGISGCQTLRSSLLAVAESRGSDARGRSRR